MKKYLFLAVCCMLATGFTACSDDDDNEGGGSETPANNAPNVSESLGIEHLVTSTYGGGGNATFNYSNGKMTNGVTNGNTNFVITENPLKINMSNIGEYGSYISNITDIKTNANGFVTYAKSKSEETYEEETYSYEGTITFEYDADGHLTKQVVTESEDGYTYTYPTTYTWVNGNLTKIVTIDEDEEYSYTCTSTYEFEYASDASVNVNPGIFFGGMYDDDYLCDFMWYAALLGKTTKNIPTKITYTSVEKENGETTYEYSSSKTVDVTYNSNGSVESITYTDTDYGYPSTVYYSYNGEQLESNIQAGISSKTIKSPRKMRHHRK